MERGRRPSTFGSASERGGTNPEREGTRSERGEPRSERGGTTSERGRIGALRIVVLTAVVCGLVIGALYGPQLADEIDLEAVEDGVPFPDRGSPPPIDERDVDRAHPDDPNGSAYDADEVIASAVVEDLVHEEVNERRVERGLDPIAWDELVASVARAHSRDMHARDFFAHTNPDDDGPFDRFEAVGDYCRAYGENIAATWVDRDVGTDGGTDRYATADELAEGLVDQWMGSPPHREAMLDDRWDRGGVGVYLVDDGRVYATHNFCTEW